MRSNRLATQMVSKDRIAHGLRHWKMGGLWQKRVYLVEDGNNMIIRGLRTSLKIF